MRHFDFISSGKRTLEIEAATLYHLVDLLDNDFVRACETLLACRGRVIVTGMGKSGHIASKIAATLASTGTPAFFVHPAEASHGDLGMFTPQDVVLALSNSGETQEIITILPLIKRLGIPLISVTANADSTLAKFASFNLNIHIEREACPLNLAPTSSTTAQLALGDALAIALLEAKGFSENDFALSHPGGSLGKKLLLKVADIMHQGAAIPAVPLETPIYKALLEMTEKRLGMTAIVNQAFELQGIFTDGDLRRALDLNYDIKSTPINTVMTQHCQTLSADSLAAEALQIMQAKKINALLVVNPHHQVIGALNMHDLLKAGIV